MLDLFYQGGTLFMSILTLEGVFLLVFSILYVSTSKIKFKEALFQCGLLAFITGILAQSIGLYQAMQGIEMMGGVSAAMLAGGLKVSFICSIYGTLLFSISLVLKVLFGVLKSK